MSLDFYLYLDADTGRKLTSFEVYSANYTHNVVPMWDALGCYEALYKSEGLWARDVTPKLKESVKAMKARMAEMRALNPENGWGNADSAFQFLVKTTVACLRYPAARIQISA